MHLLSISRAQVRLSGILTFYRETRRVLQALPGYPGLLAHDVRLRGLGTTAWTYTLWQDRQSLLDFRNGLAHTRAMMRAGSTLAAADFWLYACPTDYRPRGWPDIDRVLAGESPCRELTRPERAGEPV